MTSYWVITAAILAALFILAGLMKWTKNKILVSLLASAQLTVFLLWAFHGSFGETNLYIFCVTFFFDFIFISLGLWAYAGERRSRDESDRARNLRQDWLAIITVVGFLFFYAGPVVGWGLSDLAGEANWPALYALRVVCAIILPTISGLVLLPLLFRRPLLFYIPVVILLMALSVWSGWDTALDFRQGTRIQIIRHGCHSEADALAGVGEHCFCNGEEVSCGGAQQDEEVLLLPHTRRVLRAEKSNLLAVPGERVELQIGARGFGAGVLRGDVPAKTLQRQ
jgi:hypothetical protein